MLFTLLYVFVGEAYTLLIFTVPYPEVLTLLGLVWIGLDSVLLLGTGVYSLAFLTQPLVVVEGAARYAAVLLDFAGSSPFCRA